MSLLSISSRHFSTAAGRSPVGMLIGGDSCAEFLHEMFVEAQVKRLQIRERWREEDCDLPFPMKCASLWKFLVHFNASSPG
jgi:hypothetical protein